MWCASLDSSTQVTSMDRSKANASTMDSTKTRVRELVLVLPMMAVTRWLRLMLMMLAVGVLARHGMSLA
jgi:hypothetical protein